MNNLNQLPQHYGEVSRAPIGPKDRRVIGNPVEYRLTYINNLPVPVVIGWRSGLKFTLEPEYSLTSNRLIARVEIVISRAVKFDTQRLLSAVGKDASIELQAMREAFEFHIDQNQYGGCTLVLDYPITMEQLRSYGGTVYYNELDNVISLLPFDQVPPHPYSDGGKVTQLIDAKMIGRDEFGFGYSIETIDNIGQYGDRYLNINNKVYKVTAKKDVTRRDGVYVVSNNPVHGNLETSDTGVKHYSFEIAEEMLGLYRSVEEALTLGDLSSAKKQEIISLEHSLAVQKSELQTVKQKYELEMIAKEKEMKEFALERDRQMAELDRLKLETVAQAEAERNRTKDFYENRSYVRKDTAESIKFLPAIVTGIGTMFLMFKSLFG